MSKRRSRAAQRETFQIFKERKKLSIIMLMASLLLRAASACTGDHDQLDCDCDCPGCRSILRCLAGCQWNGVPQSKCVSTCESPEGGRPCLSDCKKCLSVCRCKCVISPRGKNPCDSVRFVDGRSETESGEMDERPGKGDSQEDDLVLSLRRLEISDNAKGFVDLLSQLSSATTPLADADFRARFAELAALGDNHFVVVAEDRRTGRIVATGSVFVERKFLRGGGKVGHIEDVVVDSAFRGRHLGHRVVGFLRDYAKAAGCYKVILNNTTDLRSFYEKCGFTEKNIQMACYF